MSTHVLDHIVHLTPPGTVEQASESFRKLGFEVIPGGTHADGRTYNALVSLSDGVYLELIAFVNSPADPTHRWGTSDPTGWVDYANLGLDRDVAGIVNRRGEKDGSGTKYNEGVDGGRETPQGKRLEWRVTTPAKGNGVGRLPFFCGDVTPREWRVPKAGSHSSTAKGVAYVKIFAQSTSEFETLTKQITTVLALPPSNEQLPEPIVSPSDSRVVSWPLTTPSPVEDLHPQLVLVLREDAPKSGIAEVGFWVDKNKGGIPESEYGKVVFVPVI
ncbi:hypothetical protein M422DRAFT_71554 [Sphaerobolus stellatus SS14]|uniref:Glyoxalase-like domain-containing protein n=1 Tax=Sphaerobolus stellatus (strain SS14) TaxID=990650 RepID=A0A0C9U1G6_SPHS4|nr:hypothetical protein M422DRAFT_71554 [Sphaerobolus stellatus SS14]